MNIVELTKKDFDNYAINHKNKSFYQTSAYGELMNETGFKSFYIGMIDENNIITAAALILYKKLFLHYKFGYSPRGFLIDFNDKELVRTFTSKIKRFLSVRNFVFLKIDPPIINKKRNNDGSIIKNSINNEHIIDFLQRTSYLHLGFNNYFEALKPRWNIITKINGPSSFLFRRFDKGLKTKIRSAEKKGITIYQGNKDNIKEFYTFVKKKHHIRHLNYYEDFWNIFSNKGMFELWFAKIDGHEYLKFFKNKYDKEIKRNQELIEEMQQNHFNKDKIINKKIESDNLLHIYKKNVIFATKIATKYPEGKTIAASAIIKYGTEIFFLIDGYDFDFKNFYSNHYLKWKIMEKYTNEGYHTMHLNGISGNFEKEDNKYYGLYDFKINFNGEITEYIGEFDLIIKRTKYNLIKNIYLLRKRLKLNK